MNGSRLVSRILAVVWLGSLVAADVLAVRRTEDPLALVPAGAATVGVIHWSELRTSPLGAKVFSEMDGISTDGDAARFLAEAQLNLREDVDTMIIAMAPPTADAPESGLVFFQGRFDVDRLSAAIVARGAAKKTAAGGSYYRLGERDGSSGYRAGDHGSVAFINRGLIVAGDEAAVVAVLARRESGGGGGLMEGEGLGRHLGRIQKDASAWALVDLKRLPAARNAHAEAGAAAGPAATLVGAMKNMSVVALQASMHGDDVELAATGVSSDSETRGLLEDSLRGILAMWRLAVQEKSPELVSVIRRFQVENDGQGVSIRGTLPASVLKSLMAERKAGK
jgi:hypothetical protein